MRSRRKNIVLATVCAGILTQVVAARANRLPTAENPKDTFADLLHKASNFQPSSKLPIALKAKASGARHGAHDVLADSPGLNPPTGVNPQRTGKFILASAPVDDNTPPNVSISNPHDADEVTTTDFAAAGVNGNASDDQAVDHVDVVLSRFTVRGFEYWNGASWARGGATLSADVTGAGTASATWKLDNSPTADTLIPGNYEVDVTAYDTSGNPNYAIAQLSVDPANILPTVTISSPLDGSDNAFGALGSISGTASDDNAVTDVQGSLSRTTGGVTLYWDGGNWVGTETWVEISGVSFPGDANPSWAWYGNFPTGLTMGSGSFTAKVRASDDIGYGDPAVVNFTVDPQQDTSPPYLGITSFSDGDELTPEDFANDGVSGYVGDDQTLSFYHVTLSRNIGGQISYWNGAGWVDAATYAPTSDFWYVNALPSGSDLVVGDYTVSITAEDTAGNSNAASASFTITAPPDTTPPTAGISYPGSGAVLKPIAFTIAGAGGTASDDTAMASLQVRLIRNYKGTLSYWDGATWQSSPTDATVSATGLGSTSVDWTLANMPAPGNLISARYSLEVTATDAAGNAGTKASQNFVVTNDSKRPVTTITTPATAARLVVANFAAGGAATGTVSDETDLWGAHVYLSRVRGGVTQYWTGSAWDTTKTAVEATVAGTNWSWTNNLPSASDLDSGAYKLAVAGYDVVGDGTAATRAFTLIGESNPPVVTIASPVASARLTSAAFAASTVNGSVSDDTGVSTVSVKLYRTISGVKTYWNGSSWVATTATVPLNQSTVDPHSLTWSLQSLPAAGLLAAGSYAVQAVATDIYGNSATSTRPFTIVTESVKPVVTISSPTATITVDGSKIGSSTFKGTATDNVQVASVTAKLYRTRAGVKQYFDGTSFSATSAAAPVTVTGLNTASATWTLNPLPAKAVLDTGVYGLLVQATDEAGNTGSASVTFNVFADNVLPVGTISSPAINATISSDTITDTTMTGTATDDISVSAIRVKLTRTRNSVKEYWTGTAWTTTATNAQITSTSLNTTSATWALAPAPATSDLDNGLYSLSVTPVDPSGNVAIPVTHNFTVTIPVPALKFGTHSGKSF